VEWIIPEAHGLHGNHLEDPGVFIPPEQKRKYFVELLMHFCTSLDLKWSAVLEATVG